MKAEDDLTLLSVEEQEKLLNETLAFDPYMNEKEEGKPERTPNLVINNLAESSNSQPSLIEAMRVSIESALAVIDGIQHSLNAALGQLQMTMATLSDNVMHSIRTG